MNDDLFFCKKWFESFKKASNPLSRDKAARLHEKGEAYTVLVGSETSPSMCIDVMRKKGCVFVGFLDEFLRNYLDYSFKLLENDTLFLSSGVRRVFKGDTKDLIEGTLYLFKEDGRLVLEKGDYISSTRSQSETFNNDVSTNYETFPSFGDYTSIMRKERWFCSL